ncbi:MAG: transposase family protein [Acidobacteria bacterium]|nr:MAG: transposase family protein [Acidobacteriota bacterium]
MLGRRCISPASRAISSTRSSDGKGCGSEVSTTRSTKARALVDVAPRRRRPLCGICGRKVRKNKDRYTRYWRHLDMFGVRTYLRYSIRRVVCRQCGVVREKVPWAAVVSILRWNEPFELFEPILDEYELRRRSLVARPTFFDHQEALAVGRYIVRASSPAREVAAQLNDHFGFT